MLLTLKEDTTGSFHLCYLLCALSMIIKSGARLQCLFINTYYMYRWHGGMYQSKYAISHCMCGILFAIGALNLLCICMWIL